MTLQETTLQETLAAKIDSTSVRRGELAIYYLGQAGFFFKTATGKRAVLDPYLSNVAERLFGFKRMIPAIIAPDELDADLYLATHSHVDHLDTDTIPIVAGNPKAFFIAAPDCREIFVQQSIAPARYAILSEGETIHRDSVSIRAIFAEHGELAPEAVGLLIDFDGIKVYSTGDTAFEPEKIRVSLATEIDVLIAPINGQFGNMNAMQSVQLARILKPRLTIASHFWMFLEHVGEAGSGDPTTFLHEAKLISEDGMSFRVMAPGERLLFPTDLLL